VRRAAVGLLRCGAPWLAQARVARLQGVADVGAVRLGGNAAPDGSVAAPETMRPCSNCVLLCTTRESARLWEKTGLFNLRLSSDAPNLQVENEETIEALSARTEALLDDIQQRFSFVLSLDAFSIAFADRSVYGFSHRRLSRHLPEFDRYPQNTTAAVAFIGRIFSVCVSFFCCSRAALKARADLIGYDGSVGAFARANPHSHSQQQR
jgi:hypothetical protein